MYVSINVGAYSSVFFSKVSSYSLLQSSYAADNQILYDMFWSETKISTWPYSVVSL